MSLGLSTVLLLCFFFLMYYGIRDDNEKARIAGFFLLAISVFITIVIGVVNFFQKPGKYTPYKEMVRKTLLAFFERLNKKYGGRGLEFDVRDNHYWIEIKINKKKGDAHRRQHNYDANIYDTDEEQDNRKKKGSAIDENENVPMNTEGVLHTAARDDDVSHLIKGQNADQFEQEDNVSEILKKMK
jgi:hypothetical protein